MYRLSYGDIILNYSNTNHQNTQYPIGYKIRATRWGDESMGGLALRIIGNAQRIALKLGSFILAVHSFPFGLAAGVAAWKAADILKKVCDDTASLMNIENLLSKHDISSLKGVIGHGSALANKLKKYKTIEDVPDDLKKEIDNFLNDNYETIKQLQSALQSADQRERKEVNVYLKKDKEKSFKQYREQKMKTAYKIKPANFFGDTPESNLLRIVGEAQSKVLRWGSFLSGFWTGGMGFALILPTVVITGKINDLCKEVASLLDIENLLSSQDQIAIRKLIGEGTNLSTRMKKYKTFGEMPADLQKDVNMYMNTHYKSIRQLKNALDTVEVKARKSLYVKNNQPEKIIPHSDRRLI